MKKIIAALAIGITVSAQAQQDPYFSLWQQAPSLLNPAATAATRQDYSFFINNRTQWLTTLASPFITSSFAGETRLGQNTLASGWFGAGLQATHDDVGSARLTSVSASVPISYTMEVSRNSLFSLGMRPGFINRTANNSFQTWDNQWNGIAFDNTQPTYEPSNRKFTTFDFGAGVYYQTLTRNDSRFNIGLSMNHINRPNVTHREIINELYPQYLLHTEANIRLRKYRFLLSPRLVMFKQGPINFIQGGGSIDLILKEGSRRTIFVQDRLMSFGLYYRNTGLLSATFGMTLENFSFGLAYDAPLSTSRHVTGLFGAAELYFKYAFVNGDRRRKIR
ncbi:MAG: PorP/SprF family type IX secretion system membrane protein [Crocinitomicaceae bacterium]|jgi:type IX secretion system PorP/SprF family membrane protein|nr:PorP/SprF family type IX secretion system membrane protein [Crocinitomicaceae bacterium]